MHLISKLTTYNKSLEKILENYFQGLMLEQSNNTLFVNGIDKRNAKVMKSFGKFEKRSIKNPNDPLTYEPGFKFFHKGKHFYQDSNHYSYAWQDGPAFVGSDLNLEVMKTIGYTQLLYDRHIEEFNINKDDLSSYADYKADIDRFIDDLYEFFTISKEELLKIAWFPHNFSLNSSIEDIQAAIFEQSLSGGSSAISLRSIINLSLNSTKSVKENQMSTDRSMISKARSSARRSAGNIREGGIDGLIGGANRAATKKLVDMFGPNVPPILQTEAGLTMLETLTPVFLSMGLEIAPGADKIPAATKEMMLKMCDRAQRSAADHGAREGVQALSAIFQPLFQEYMQAATAINALGGMEEEEELAPTIRERELVEVGSKSL